jgi:hypothetical protein
MLNFKYTSSCKCKFPKSHPTVFLSMNYRDIYEEASVPLLRKEITGYQPNGFLKAMIFFISVVLRRALLQTPLLEP